MGVTDITGYSLLGHGLEMAEASGTALHLEFNSIPFTSGARKYAGKGCFAGGAFDNKSYYESKVHFDRSIDEESQMLLFDPQTSGGLLLGVPETRLAQFMSRAATSGQAAWVIGRVEPGSGIRGE